ncbi:hypothetical protein SDC9_159665 [bioreactor metagenome]|uniref:Uncharacterized protein n=1 Tax=bioreactor metagenome TaxID=1076179 RepID=A0A645FG70_9ZZZZ
MGLAVLIGMEKPIPSTPATEILALLIPTTTPSAFTKAPPELPGLIAASVWISLNLRSPISMERFKALITPAVTLPLNSRPSGLPIAIAGSPRIRLSESPRAATGKPVASTLTTARSVAGSEPSTLPGMVRPSNKETTISWAFSTT